MPQILTIKHGRFRGRPNWGYLQADWGASLLCFPTLWNFSANFLHPWPSCSALCVLFTIGCETASRLISLLALRCKKPRECPQGKSQLIMELAWGASPRGLDFLVSACFGLYTKACKQLLCSVCLEFMIVIYRRFSFMRAMPPWIETDPPRKLISNIHWLPVLCHVLCRFTYITTEPLNNIRGRCHHPHHYYLTE